MDFVDGETLAARVQRGRLSDGEAISVGREVCRALAAVHQARLIHRDVKAQNVMRAHDGGRIILMDFGAGEFVGDPLDARAQGTPLYLAPELLRGGGASVRTDIYAVGVLLYHLVTGRFPVEGASPAALVDAHARGERRRLRDERPDLSESFIALVERAIDPNPVKRYASAGEMEARLSGEKTDRVAVTPGTRAAALKTLGPGRRPAWAAGWVIAGILLFVTLVGAITSTFYYIAIGLSGPFRTESPLSWPVWGLRALLAPLILTGGGTAMGLVLLTVLYRQVIETVGPLKSVAEPIAVRVQSLIRSIREVPTASMAPLLFLAQCGFLALTWWWFGDLLGALDSLVVQTAGGDLAPLSTANAGHQKLFRQVVSMQFIAMTAAWLLLYWTRNQRHERGGWLSLSGGVAATFVTVTVLVLPYRILLHNVHERVVHRSETCYLIGQIGNEGLLFCPLQRQSRNRSVRLDASDLERGGAEENVFTRVGPSVNNMEVK
jgi:hypothetical protein